MTTAQTRKTGLRKPENRPALNVKMLEAASIEAEEGLTANALAKRIGVSDVTVERYRSLPHYNEHVSQLMAQYDARVLNKGIARKGKRIEALVETHSRLERIIAERAEAYASVPGGKTGYITEEVKISASGKTVRVYKLDLGLVRALNETRKQIAQEAGQWEERPNLHVHVWDRFKQALEQLPTEDSIDAQGVTVQEVPALPSESTDIEATGVHSSSESPAPSSQKVRKPHRADTTEREYTTSSGED